MISPEFVIILQTGSFIWTSILWIIQKSMLTEKQYERPTPNPNMWKQIVLYDWKFIQNYILQKLATL